MPMYSVSEGKRVKFEMCCVNRMLSASWGLD